MTNDALLGLLQQRVRQEFASAVKPGPVALLDFPNYENPGDSAIWLGAMECLSVLGFSPPVYTSDHRTFNEHALRRALPAGTILLSGGGNLGDLWPAHQNFREHIVRSFPNHAIVQLPQSIHFDSPAALTTARIAFSGHGNLTLLVRDARSLDVATSGLKCRASLCPDMAFGLSPRSEPSLGEHRERQPRSETIRLLRTDHEAARNWPGGEHTSSSVDWVDDVSSPLARFANRLAGRLAGTDGASRDNTVVDNAARTLLSACYPRLARARVRRGCRLLRSARVVVTDRLHGHVLALLLGVPHVLLGDRNGKLRAFVDTWTSSATLLRWADSPDDVDRLAAELLACS